MTITKDDLFASDNGLLIACSNWEKTGDEILKNQEIAKFLEGRESIMTYEEEAEEAKQIVKRLKKQIEFIKNLNYKEDGHTKRVLELLQKVLEGEK